GPAPLLVVGEERVAKGVGGVAVDVVADLCPGDAPGRCVGKHVVVVGPDVEPLGAVLVVEFASAPSLDGGDDVSPGGLEAAGQSTEHVQALGTAKDLEVPLIESVGHGVLLGFPGAGLPSRVGRLPRGDGRGGYSVEGEPVGGGAVVAAGADGVGGDDFGAGGAAPGGMGEAEVVVLVVPEHLGAVVCVDEANLGVDDAGVRVELELVEQGSGLGHGVLLGFPGAVLPSRYASIVALVPLVAQVGTDGVTCGVGACRGGVGRVRA